MDSDEDFQSIPPLEEPSPQIQRRRLKRLKKANPESPANSSLDPAVDPLLLSSVDFSKLEALENEPGALDSNDSNSADDLLLHQETVSQGNIDENENAIKDNLNDGSNAGVKKKTKRALEFEAEHVGDGGERSIEVEQEKDQSAEEIFPEEKGSKKKNKRGKSDDTEKPVNKRREEKERNAYLKELHAESQRLLRESSGAAFKPTPVTRKPMSSILEKIRKRKLELSKKFSILNDQACVSEDDNNSRGKMDFDIPNINEIEKIENDVVTSGVDVQRSLTPSKLDGCDDVVKLINHKDVNQALNEEPGFPFQAPLQDTEDLFDDSLSNSNAVEPDSEKQSVSVDKKFVPSVLDFNLKFDSVPTDDSSSDDEDNDKENVDPGHLIPGGSSSIGGHVKNFVDDEAEEEYDSDNDPDHMHENEDGEDVENYEDLEDMIATEYEEKPIDKERRNTLHQQWLEQQDATGTDNLLQRLKCGQGIRDTILTDKKPESDEDDEGFDDDDEAQEQRIPRYSSRVTTRKAKQIILQMFSDKEDVYLSDDDEDTDWRIAKQRLIRNEEKGTLISPVNSEDSCEVFGLIKKLDIATGNKKKPKLSSYFDAVLKGGNTNSSSKSSFLGRVSNHPMPSFNKQGSGMVRSFIFGRDDSSSRSSITVSEDSSDSVSREIHPTRSFAAKLSSSQTKFSSKNTEAAASTTSLLEILKRPSRPNICNQDTTVDLSKGIFSLKIPKRTMKIQGRS